MASLDESAIIELGKAPIPGADPCGQDIADDEQCILVLAEVGKMDRIDTSEPPDWYQIEQDATALLKSKAKDLEMATALGAALFHNYRYAGLAAYLGMATELVNTFWDGLFPARPRRRKALLESLTDRFPEGGWFRENQPNPDEFDAIDSCVARIEALKNALVAKMADDPPDFVKFTRGLKDLAGLRPAQAAPAAPAPQPGAPAAAPAAAAPGEAPAAMPAAEVADASGAINALLSAATFLRKADPTDPVPYAIVRVVKWSKISLPTSDEAKSQSEPPEGSVLEMLTHQSTKGLWDKLLKNAEGAFRSNDPLWLDLQRHVCTAMEGLGPTYGKARQAVIAETAGLVKRLGDGLYDLSFRDGTPLCSGETRMWIESNVTPPEEGGRGTGGDGKLDEAWQEARKRAGSGQLKEAVQALQEGLTTCTQRRDRFLWRLRIAQLCQDAQRYGLVAPLLEQCQGEIEQFHIEEWEPTLAVEVAEALYRCRKALTSAEKKPAPEVLQGVQDSFAWLCQLDPLAALVAEPSGKKK